VFLLFMLRSGFFPVKQHVFIKVCSVDSSVIETIPVRVAGHTYDW